MDNYAELPADLKALRACLRCALIKNFNQFYENGCDNCSFLSMAGNTTRVHECTTAYFEGFISLQEPASSWAAKWMRLNSFEAGIYAMDVTGDLPDDAKEMCENMNYEYRAIVKANK